MSAKSLYKWAQTGARFANEDRQSGRLTVGLELMLLRVYSTQELMYGCAAG